MCYSRMSILQNEKLKKRHECWKLKKRHECWKTKEKAQIDIKENYKFYTNFSLC